MHYQLDHVFNHMHYQLDHMFNQMHYQLYHMCGNTLLVNLWHMFQSLPIHFQCVVYISTVKLMTRVQGHYVPIHFPFDVLYIVQYVDILFLGY